MLFRRVQPHDRILLTHSPPSFSHSGGTSVSSADYFFNSLERKLRTRTSYVDPMEV